MSSLAPKAIKDLYEGLLGSEVTLSDGRPVLPGATPKPTSAVYVDDHGKLSAIALMDFPLTVWTGAALALLPRGGAEEAITEGQVPEMLLENTAEVLNVLAAPIGDASGVHQRLQQTFGPQETPPPHVPAWAVTLGSRLDVTIDVAGYGPGRLSIINVPTG